MEQHSRTRPSMTENVAIVIAARSVFQSRHITPLFSSEGGGGVDKHGDTRRGNKSAAGAAAECMNAERGRERYNAHGECTEQSKQPYKALLPSWVGERRTGSACSAYSCGSCVELLPTHAGNVEAQKLFARPTSSIRMREGVASEALLRSFLIRLPTAHGAAF